MVFILLLDVSTAALGPSKCVLTIISCCNPEQPPGRHPFRCFEVNECAGLYWEGQNACAGKTVARAIAALDNDMEIETRFAGIGDNRVELEQKARGPKRLRFKSRRSRSGRLSRGSLLRSDERVQPVFHKDSNRHFLQISPFGLGRK